MVVCLVMLIFFQDEPFYVHYKLGTRALEQKDYATAIRRLEAAVAKDPVSKKQKKTYGVQFIQYYPYHHLAQAYLWNRDLEKVRENIALALEYQEDEDKNVAFSLEACENIMANFQAFFQESRSPDLSEIWQLIGEGNFSAARNTLRGLLSQNPNDPNLTGMEKLLEALINNQQTQGAYEERLASLQRQTIDYIAELLRRARIQEEQENFNEALANYLAVSTLAADHLEAGQAIQRLKAKMEGQGRTEAEIQEAIAQAQQQIEALDKEISQITRKMEQVQQRNYTLVQQLAGFRNKKPELVPKFDFKWDLSPSSSQAYAADIHVRVIGNTPMKSGRLLVNGRAVDNWDLAGLTHFSMPKMYQYSFDRLKNELIMEIVDQTGKVHRDPYPFNLPNPPRPLGPAIQRMILLVGIASILFVFFLRIRQSRQAFRNRFNPYIAGAPVLSDNMFYGRRPLLKQILNTLHNNSLMIYGERRIGKTTFLHQLHATLPEIEDPHFEFIPVFIDLQGVRESQFFSLMDHEIAQTLELHDIHLDPPQELLDARGFTQRVRQFINALKKQCGKIPKLVLLLDEVDIMNGFSERTNQQLRSVFMKGFAKHLVAVMAGIHINTTWKSEGSPWYNFFEQIELKPFSMDQSQMLITDPVKNVYQFTRDAIELIIRLTNGKPYLIQKICVNLIAHILNENRRKITSQDVDFVFSEIKSEVFATK